MPSLIEFVCQSLGSEVQPQAKEIYDQMPGSFLNFLKIEKVDNRYQYKGEFVITGELETSEVKQNYFTLLSKRYDTSKEVVPYTQTQTFKEKTTSTQRRSVTEQTSPLSSTIYEPNEGIWKLFRLAFLDSFEIKFQENPIDEFKAENIVHEIFSRYKTNRSSLNPETKVALLPIRFEESLPTGDSNSHIYNVTAYIETEPIKKIFSNTQTKVSYEIIVDFEGISFDGQNFRRFKEMLKQKDVSKITETIVNESKIKWEGFLTKR